MSQPFPDKAVLSVNEVVVMLSMSRVSFWSLRKTDPTFPKPLTLGDTMQRFSKKEVLAWIESKSII